jgi:hypothetical protein
MDKKIPQLLETNLYLLLEKEDRVITHASDKKLQVYF